MCRNPRGSATTRPDVIEGRSLLGTDQPVVFSPFGLGVLDLVVGSYAHRRAAESGELTTIDGFFNDLARHHIPERQEHRER